MSVRDEILNKLDFQSDPPTADDEIVAALERQLEVLDGTMQIMALQIRNLRAEVALFSQPAQSEQSRPPTPPSTVTRSSGAIVEASLPEPKRLPDFCDHEDALVVDTVEGPQRVCPDCVPA